LRVQAADLPQIIFTGALTQSQLGNYYVYALATIVPSLTYETFGITTVEAFARKTPAIVRDLGALPEVIEDSGGGLVYCTDEELLDCIRQIGTEAALRDELGEEGYRTFLRLWSREAHLELYDELRRNAATSRSAPAA
jgi:glycosyltransferase involved in cell wall biosynthesis